MNKTKFQIIIYLKVILLIFALSSPLLASDSQEIKIIAKKNSVSATDKKSIEGMVFIKGGCFKMGDTYGVGSSDELPAHKVCVDNFYLGEHEIEQRKWQEIMGNNPSSFKNCGEGCPVENITWHDVQKFIKKLNNDAGMSYRLPTEAEWEYAAREGGKRFVWSGTSTFKKLEDYAWYEHNSGKKTHAVKSKKPNSLGLYDMTGNVWEWIFDRYDRNYYKKNNPHINPKGASKGSDRLVRGGSWVDLPRHCRSTFRLDYDPRGKAYTIGFRLAHSAITKK
ncbi:MAG TPA: formylglycine-generating enzyme family protein [Nitrospinota bacterium]|nr:formylglycine-generating enzyme family protein [Nitrospinota bacterium]